MHTDISHRPWSSLQHPQVRNLAWCVFSPSLVGLPATQAGLSRSVKPEFEIHEPTCRELDRDWLTQLDAAPEPLMRWMASCHSSRLGFQFEHYWQFWWRHREPHHQHLFNVQLHDGGQTLGELDALSWRPDLQQLTHTELAVKFYLGVESDTLPEDFRPGTEWCWVGPNVRDRLDLKWLQLQQHQLRHLPQAASQGPMRAELPRDWRYRQLRTQLVMRGRLFYPLGVLPEWTAAPYVNPYHQHGLWLRLSQFLAISALDQTAARWKVLRRDQWFAPLLCAATDSLDISATAQHLSGFFRTHQRPVQLALLQPATWSQHGLWEERQRWFVVPDQWPRIT